MLASAIVRWRDRVPSWTRVDFTMQHQCQTEWCWAATSVSVSAYYDPQTSWTQCTMVNAEKGLSICCEDGSSDACNNPNRLDHPLNRADVLDHKQAGPIGYDTIGKEIDAGRPIALRIGWSRDGDPRHQRGHFAVIDAYESSGDQWIAIDDPWWGPWDGPVSTLFQGMYHGSGSWTHTYFTRPQTIQSQVVHEIRLPREVWERVLAEESRLRRQGEER